MAQNVKELFGAELRDIYDAENKLVDAIGKMIEEVQDEELISAFEEHRSVTEQQTQRLEQVFELAGLKPRREKCHGIEGLIKEFQEFAGEGEHAQPVLDLFAATAAAKVEHYEISTYTSLIELAQALGLDQAVQLLRENLDEERETASLLERLAPELAQRAELGEITLPEETPAT